MLPGLSAQENEALLLSVGRTPKDRRPLSPIEVGEYCARAKAAGASVKKITGACLMTDTSMVSKFIKLTRDLREDLRHMVDWGVSRQSVIGFSVAAVLARFEADVQPSLAEDIVKNRLSKTEMMSVHQLVERSGDSIATCVARVVKRRPVTVVRYMYVGAVTSSAAQAWLAKKSQRSRDELFAGLLRELYEGVDKIGGKLGPTRYLITGGKRVADVLEVDRAKQERINDWLLKAM